ncbi:translation initiation factor IF-2-like [Anopheles stephensi]|uniref:translation initiation factor IF-2-like n=1 Tax=Anopheles stephensi TaxID=30069 RepID=UPI001658B819|nr:translation initiation factor IF-2-like [Anopheles stephensi]
MFASRSSFRRFPVWSVVLLLLHVSVAQQYTGVKSVSSSPEVSQIQPAHSARSVDGGIPATDSNIINLAITPFARGQGFSAAKGRNLGFANDASLNAIPAGINNELSNVDVRGTTQPQQNTVLRDSYGNPVTPFTDLAKPELDSVGFLTNVNRGANFQSAGQYNFKVPSYASGIIEPIGQPNFGLLPPNPVPSTVQVVPPRSTTTAKPFSTQQQFLPNAKIPNIEEGKILFAQKPVNGLLPPLFPDQLPPVYDIKVGTERSTIFARDPFVGPVKPTPQQPSVPQAAVGPDSIVGYKTDVNQQTNFPKPGSPATETRFSGSAAPAGPTFATTSKPVVQKYNGGFGGPAGFLGNQQNLGTAYTSTVRPNVPQVVPTAPQPPQQRPQTVFIPQNQSPTTARPEDKTTVQKYVGSFGGPPGFLGNQANLGTAYTKPPQTLAANVPTVAPAQQPPQHFGPAHTGPVPTSPQPAVPPRPVSVPSVPSVPNKFNGPFVGPPVNQGAGIRPTSAPIFTPPAQPVRPVPTSNTFNGGNKFTGSFGGAPGILGNQQRPGTNVKPDGSIFASAQPQQQHAQHHQQQQQQQTLPQQFQQPKPVTDTFTGSFGGPPGVLRPFDNTKG